MKLFAALVIFGLAYVASSFYLDQGAHSLESANSGFRARVPRQADSGTSNTLTVEWKGGIYSGLKVDKLISRFQVEYRPEAEDEWRKRDGIVPYKGPNIQYRVRIRDLPFGGIYFVRIKVIGHDGQVMITTREIRAQSQ